MSPPSPTSSLTSSEDPIQGQPSHPPRLLLTGGPTHEPIDAVRYIGNRSSGRVSIALADAAAARGWEVTLLLGPTPLVPREPTVDVTPYVSCADLEQALIDRLPACDVLVMAAAVSDYRPITGGTAAPGGKRRRDEERITLELERTPDLLAACAERRSPGQTLVGFALEPRDRLIESARDKLVRKGVDLIVANALETMESASIEAWLLAAGIDDPIGTTGGAVPKADFAEWLLDRIVEHRRLAPRGAERTRRGATSLR